MNEEQLWIETIKKATSLSGKLFAREKLREVRMRQFKKARKNNKWWKELLWWFMEFFKSPYSERKK